MIEFTRAIIAGGMSRRMGVDKAFLKIDGVSIVERILINTEACRQRATLIITNMPDAYKHLGYPIFSDALPNMGALGGIYTSLLHSSTPYVFVTACDMPFVSADLWTYMLKQAEGYDIVVPRVGGYPQGLQAIYHRNCLPTIGEQLESGKLKVIGFYTYHRVRYLDEEDYAPYNHDGLALMNVNTPEELQHARERAQSKYDEGM